MVAAAGDGFAAERFGKTTLATRVPWRMMGQRS
jgi:hypothetical protein